MIFGMAAPLSIAHVTAVSALGEGVDSHIHALLTEQTGLKKTVFGDADQLNTWIGQVAGLESVSFPARLQKFACRNNRLAYLALIQDGFDEAVRQYVVKYGAHRVGVFIGTSTSGILETELAYQEAAKNHWQLPEWYCYEGTHNNYSVTQFVRNFFGLNGVSQTISTACSSSAKVFATAARAVRAGFCDVALVGGVDSLCYTTLYGFNSLQLLSQRICRPFDVNRSGINIGEAAAFFLLTLDEQHKVRLLGYGESSDAYHMSSPHPEGQGAKLAIERALQSAELTPFEIDYVNLHGTGTKANDQAEALALISSLNESVVCGSTKGWTGHTLGAAGALEAVFAYISIMEQWVPRSLNLETPDPLLCCNLIQKSFRGRIKNVLSNSFGFGGNNCALIFGESR